ncbi:MAG: hypothetical protein IKH55_04560 [Fibrobacter sp.]|nr:hypothetical protein [Fibrobacter sp.]
MKHLLNTLFFLLICVSSAMAAYVAVLETGVDLDLKKKVSLSDRQYLTNVLREEAVKELPASQNFTIMTRENINVMLPPGKAIEDCEGSCLAETGRNIAADYVCQARVGKFGSKLTISAEIYETAGSKLVASFNGHGANVEELLKVIKDNASEFFRKVKGDDPSSSPKSGGRRVNKGAGGIGDFLSSNNSSEEFEANEISVGSVNLDSTPADKDNGKVLRSSKPIGDVPAVKNRAKNAWIRWGSIIAGSALLSTGLVLAVINDEQPVRGVGIAMSIIGTIGIGISYAF